MTRQSYPSPLYWIHAHQAGREAKRCVRMGLLCSEGFHQELERLKNRSINLVAFLHILPLLVMHMLVLVIYPCSFVLVRSLVSNRLLYRRGLHVHRTQPPGILASHTL